MQSMPVKATKNVSKGQAHRHHEANDLCSVDTQQQGERQVIKNVEKGANLVDRVASCIGGLHASDHFGLFPDPKNQVPLGGTSLGCQQAAICAEGHAGNVLHCCQSGDRQTLLPYN